MTEKHYIPFTEEMKKDYTLLVPNMLPIHFSIIVEVMHNMDYKAELLRISGPQVAERGLRYVHNDTCYPAILIIGQFLCAIESGEYDPHKVALVYFQTGGGCRASNYISLLRKALAKAGYGYVPVISISFDGLEEHPGFKIGLKTWYKIFYSFMYSDVIMALSEQVKPYEVHKGETEALVQRLTAETAEEMKKSVSWGKAKKYIQHIIDSFAAVPQDRSTLKPRVGVVGEIYVKFSPLGNNNLGDFLVEYGAEVVLPGLMNFMLYLVHNKMVDYELYHSVNGVLYHLLAFAHRFLLGKQHKIYAMIERDGVFRAPERFEDLAALAERCIHHGCKMGEGWLLPAEMIALAENGTPNIICTQPFGCLPNHICGKGMMKPVKALCPDANIVAIDYDASATRVNQENRIKLMLANAKK